MDKRQVTEMNRHDMVWITDHGLQFAREYAARIFGGELPHKPEDVMISGIPAIITRQSVDPYFIEHDKLWQVGFSSHKKLDGCRLRIASSVPETEIRTVTTPFEAAARLCRQDSKAAAVVRELTALGETTQLQVGIYGSLAMETLTGLPYFTDSSDYDIWISPADQRADGTEFYRRMKEMEAAVGTRIDCEINCDGYGVKLKELAAGSATVLGKGLFDVRLLKACTYRTLYFN